jgi:hypothetical protein
MGNADDQSYQPLYVLQLIATHTWLSGHVFPT